MTVPAKIKRKQIKTYRERSFHVGCGGEWLSQESGMSDTFKTRWLHQCDKCKGIADLDDRFPRVVHD